MKGLNCPNCGRRQDVKLPTPGQATVDCPECGKRLFVRMKKGRWSVDVDDGSGGEIRPLPQAQPQPQTQAAK